MPTRPFHDPGASAEESRCPRNSASDAGTSARHADHGRDQKQYDRDEEDDLGDFDGGSGNTAESQNACDQRDDQKRNDPAQHDTNLYFDLLFRHLRNGDHRASDAEIIRFLNEGSGSVRVLIPRKNADPDGTKLALHVEI